jgi:hypothetical protein
MVFDPGIFDEAIFDTGAAASAMFDPAIFDPCIFDTDAPCPSDGGGGAAKFGGLSRGMLVADQQTWEDDGIILPLMLDDFP